MNKCWFGEDEAAGRWAPEPLGKVTVTGAFFIRWRFVKLTNKRGDRGGNLLKFSTKVSLMGKGSGVYGQLRQTSGLCGGR